MQLSCMYLQFVFLAEVKKDTCKMFLKLSTEQPWDTKPTTVSGQIQDSDLLKIQGKQENYFFSNEIVSVFFKIAVKKRQIIY